MQSNNQYYILKHAVGTKETGMAYPAVESYGDYDFNGPNSVYKLDSDSFPDLIPDIRFRLAKEAKLCDIMGQATISACGLLVSQNVKNILEQFNLIPHKYFSAIIENKGTYYQYYWVHFVWEAGIKYLDFKNSKFEINEFGNSLGEIKLNSYDELLDKQTYLGFMKMIYNYETVMLKTDYDLFNHPLNKTIYLSENLRNKLAIFTGVELTHSLNLIVLP
jgi:hypothetical protein